jgi:hypothetical protein
MREDSRARDDSRIALAPAQGRGSLHPAYQLRQRAPVFTYSDGNRAGSQRPDLSSEPTREARPLEIFFYLCSLYCIFIEQISKSIGEIPPTF